MLFLWEEGQVRHFVGWLPAYADGIIGQFSGLPPIDAIHISGELRAGRPHIVNGDLLSVLFRMLGFAVRLNSISVGVKYLLESVCIHSTDIAGP